MQLKYNPEEFLQLIASSPAYTTKIEAFAKKISEFPLQEQLLCLSQCTSILQDESIPTIKKLLVFRFIKDTLLLASLSFYECVVVKIFPWLIAFSFCFKSVAQQDKVAQAGRILRGNKKMEVPQISVCKNMVNLVEDILKWMGSYIQNHPYSKIQFKSAFRFLLEKYPQIMSKKVTDLNFFKPQDPNRYQAYYLQKQAGQAEGQKIGQYIKTAFDEIQKGKQNEILTLLLQTGDESVIYFLIEELQIRLEAVERKNAEQGMLLTQTLNELFLLGEIHFCNQAKLQLTCPLTVLALMLQHHKIKLKGQSASSRILSYLTLWEKKCQELKIPTQALKLAIKKLKLEGIQPLNNLLMQAKPKLVLNFVSFINKDKLNQLIFDQTQTLLKIQSCKYVQLEEIDKIIEKPLNISKNAIDQVSNSASHSTIKSYNKKSHFLEAYSNFPASNQPQLKNNVSEVNEIYFQHSNLSERFHQFQQNTPQDSNSKNLIMSFKMLSPHFAETSKSPEVVFTDSFTSNQKFSPPRQSNKYAENIQIIKENPNKIQNSQISRSSQKSKDKSVAIVFNNSFERQIQELNLKQQSYKRQTSKINQVSDYYKQSIKQSANFAKPHVIQTKKGSINEYMMPNKNSQIDSVRRSKQSYNQRQQNSLYSVKSTQKKISKSRPKKEGSLSSKIQKSRSIKLLYFNQSQKPGDRGYQLGSTQEKIIAVQAIRVEKTVLKPKFGFKCLEQESNRTQTLDQQSAMKQINFTNKSQSLSFYPSISGNSLPIQQVPQNFKDVLKSNKNKVKVNQYQHKTKELQVKIQRMRQKKERMQNQVKIKSQEIAKIKAQLPTPIDVLQEENKSLLKALKIKKLKSIDNEFKSEKNEKKELKGSIFHVAGNALKQELKKQILYLKCKLYQDQILEIGVQVKNKQLALYFSFLIAVDECSINVQEHSLKLSQSIDAKIYNVLAGKQIKFKAKIADYALFQNNFEFAKLKVELKIGKHTKNCVINIPYHLYNQFLFHPPATQLTSPKSTDWHFCCPALRQSRHYLQDFLPNGQFFEGRYRTRIQLKGEIYDYELVVEGQKFAVQYSDRSESEQIPILSTLISIFQKNASNNQQLK